MLDPPRGPPTAQDLARLTTPEMKSKWKVFKWEVEEAFPFIPTIVQRARNAISQMAEGETVSVISFVYIQAMGQIQLK